jgi:hypothetical protein
VQNQHASFIDAVENDIFANCKTAHAGAQVMIAVASNVGAEGEKVKTVGQRVDETVRNIGASAFSRDLISDAVKFGFRLSGKAMRH